MLLLFILQKADDAKKLKSNFHPESYPLLGVQPCQVCLSRLKPYLHSFINYSFARLNVILLVNIKQGRLQDDPCINVMFTPDTPDTRTIMQTYANKNKDRTGFTFNLE